MSHFGSAFADLPIFGWSFNDYQDLEAALGKSNILDNLRDYDRYYDGGISRLIFDGGSFKIDFGGAEEKDRLIAVDRPLGVFNFSLAAKTLYKKQEYFSQELADTHPDRFKELGLPSGIIPDKLVKSIYLNDRNNYFFSDDVTNSTYNCVMQQKGTEAVRQGLNNAKLQFGSRTRKVYNTYRRKGGKVKYVEIYSLFYFSDLSTELQYAVRHLPALMVANYLESIGIKTKVYTTRFTRLNQEFPFPKIRKSSELYRLYRGTNKNREVQDSILFQPFPAKDYGEELDFKRAFLFGRKDSKYYKLYIREMLKDEVQNYQTFYPFGEPRTNNINYREAFERYSQKYFQYTKQGIWDSKELVSEGMIFFLSQSINKLFGAFVQQLVSSRIASVPTEADILLSPDVNRFFAWWMNLIANTIKFKIDIINTDNRNKTLLDIKRWTENLKLDLDAIVKSSQNRQLANTFEYYGQAIIDKEEVDDVYKFVIRLTSENTVYASGEMFATPQDDIDSRNALNDLILNDLQYI